MDERLNIIKFNTKNRKFTILGIYAPCSYLKVNDEYEKSIKFEKSDENSDISDDESDYNNYSEEEIEFN